MKFAEKYFEQVKLLLEVIPFVAKEKCFALKGGTAINMFFQDSEFMMFQILERK